MCRKPLGVLIAVLLVGFGCGKNAVPPNLWNELINPYVNQDVPRQFVVFYEAASGREAAENMLTKMGGETEDNISKVKKELGGLVNPVVVAKLPFWVSAYQKSWEMTTVKIELHHGKLAVTCSDMDSVYYNSDKSQAVIRGSGYAYKNHLHFKKVGPNQVEVRIPAFNYGLPWK
ncbi:MAG: hypothetical protein ABIC04_02230 [Nanoarchaeota archaeon]